MASWSLVKCNNLSLSPHQSAIHSLWTTVLRNDLAHVLGPSLTLSPRETGTTAAILVMRSLIKQDDRYTQGLFYLWYLI